MIGFSLLTRPLENVEKIFGRESGTTVLTLCKIGKTGGNSEAKPSVFQSIFPKDVADSVRTE